eukprot:5436925-Ditylum_brightwellii.AAC.1
MKCIVLAFLGITKVGAPHCDLFILRSTPMFTNRSTSSLNDFSYACKTDMKKQSGVAISGTAKYVHTVLPPLDMEVVSSFKD